MLSVLSQLIFGTPNGPSGSTLGSSSASGGSGGSSSLSWREKSLCFDLRPADLEPTQGEQIIASFFPIEDVKGNQDELGVMRLTNLRLVWICCTKKRVNLSIGLRKISLVFEQNVKDAFNVPVSSMCVLSKFESTKYEFVFNKMPAFSEVLEGPDGASASELMYRLRARMLETCGPNLDKFISLLTPMCSVDPFEAVFKVWQSYKHTGLFRHCRANLTHLMTTESTSLASSGAAPEGRTLETSTGKRLGELNLLPEEQIIDVYGDVLMVETRALKHVGLLVLTNIRMIWMDEELTLRNLSMPYIRVNSIKLKQADRVVVATADYMATSCQVELRVGSAAYRPGSSVAEEAQRRQVRIKLICDQMQNLCTMYKARPRFGPESCDDCGLIMSHLRLAELYLLSNPASAPVPANLGPPVDRVYLVGGGQDTRGELARALPANMSTANEKANELEDLANMQHERDLVKHGNKLRNYLDEPPLNCDQELVYWPELGLAFEKPAKDVELDRVWHLDLLEKP